MQPRITRSGRGRVALTGVLLVSSLALAPARAQQNQRGLGDPFAADKAPYTTSVGETKPPDRAGSPTATDNPAHRTALMRRNDRIDRSICNGC